MDTQQLAEFALVTNPNGARVETQLPRWTIGSHLAQALYMTGIAVQEEKAKEMMSHLSPIRPEIHNRLVQLANRKSLDQLVVRCQRLMDNENSMLGSIEYMLKVDSGEKLSGRKNLFGIFDLINMRELIICDLDEEHRLYDYILEESLPFLSNPFRNLSEIVARMSSTYSSHVHSQASKEFLRKVGYFKRASEVERDMFKDLVLMPAQLLQIKLAQRRVEAGNLVYAESPGLGFVLYTNLDKFGLDWEETLSEVTRAIVPERQEKLVVSVPPRISSPSQDGHGLEDIRIIDSFVNTIAHPMNIKSIPVYSDEAKLRMRYFAEDVMGRGPNREQILAFAREFSQTINRFRKEKGFSDTALRTIFDDVYLYVVRNKYFPDVTDSRKMVENVLEEFDYNPNK